MHIGDVHAGWARPESGASLVVHGRGIESGECFRYPGPSARDVRAQPAVNQRTGGSTFRNPLPGVSSFKAWELIDAAGGRGLTRGGAQISEKHTNFLLNTGGATAADIEGLGEEIRRRVHALSGVLLEWEIKRIGIPGGKPEMVAP